MNISSKIFLDGADPEESKKAKQLLGFLDGQTTNPTLLTRNPEAKEIVEKGKFKEEDLYSFYKKVVKEIAKTTSGPISIEVYADKGTKAEEMVEQAKKMIQWIPNGCIKLPITKEGLKAANIVTKEGIPVNMTLCFSQEQAAAVYAATKEAKASVFVSPFIGRLDDRGEKGIDLVENILKMYNGGDGHVLVLVASIRSLDHLLINIKMGCPLITIPFKIIREWEERDFILPDEDFVYSPELKEIPYKDISLDRNWEEYNINHELTDIGLERFSNDWKSVIK